MIKKLRNMTPNAKHQDYDRAEMDQASPHLGLDALSLPSPT